MYYVVAPVDAVATWYTLEPVINTNEIEQMEYLAMKIEGQWRVVWSESEGYGVTVFNAVDEAQAGRVAEWLNMENSGE